MADPEILRRCRMGLNGFILFCVTGPFTAHAANTAASPDETHLDALQGGRVMEGTLGGKPARYFADGQRVLQRGFIKLHMIDVGTPSRYEADGFIGFDPKTNDYIAHWLDRFGAPGARVVARGVREGRRLVLNFPYAEGAFRDTFTCYTLTRDPRHGS